MSILLGNSAWQRRRSGGPPGTVLAMVAVASLSQLTAGGVPDNDLCSGAFDLNTVINATTVPPYQPYHAVVDGTMAGFDTIDTLDYGGVTDVSNGIWYTFTSPGPGYLYCADFTHQYIDFENPGTIFSIVDGCGSVGVSPATFVPHEFDPAISSVTLDPTQSVYGFTSAGQTVKVLVSSGVPDFGIGPDAAQYDLTFTFVPSPAIANDTCATATVITSLPHVETVDNFLAAADDFECSGSMETMDRGVWYSYTPSWTGYLAVAEYSYFSGPGEESDKIQSIWAYATDCITTSTCVSSTYNPTGIGPNMITSNQRGLVPIKAGQTVRILIGGESSPIDGYVPRTIYISLAPDSCDIALPVAIGSSVDGYLTPGMASFQLGGLTSCDDPQFIDLWYSVTITQAGDYVFRTYGRKTDIGIYTGCTGSSVACITDDGVVADEFGQFRVTGQVSLNPGTYVIRVTATSTDDFVPSGLFTLFVDKVICAADFNHVNGVTVQDIFDFLTAWLAGSPSADFNHVNGVTVQDIFDFLTAWLAGC